MHWHEILRIKNGVLGHLVYSVEWTTFGVSSFDFSTDARNVIFALLTDGFLSFGHGMNLGYNQLYLLTFLVDVH